MLLDLVSKNRSYRRFDEEKRLTQNDLLEMVNCARLSPSASNRQVLRYYLVTEKKDCDLIFPHLGWAGYLKTWDGPEPGERPAAYIIMLIPRKAGNYQFVDSGIAAQSIMLSAAEKGIGGCILGSVQKEAVQSLFRLPASLEVVLVLALGIPAEKVVLEEMADPSAIEYWRDEDGAHHVPKRKLEDIILSGDSQKVFEGYK